MCRPLRLLLERPCYARAFIAGGRTISSLALFVVCHTKFVPAGLEQAKPTAGTLMGVRPAVACSVSNRARVGLLHPLPSPRPVGRGPGAPTGRRSSASSAVRTIGYLSALPVGNARRLLGRGVGTGTHLAAGSRS